MAKTKNKELKQFKSRAAWLEHLDSSLSDKWIEERKLGNKTHFYYSTTVQELIADLVFSEWNVIEEKYFQIMNEICCTVRISYTPNHPDALPLTCTGSAASAITAHSGSNPEDIAANKMVNSLEFNLPKVRKLAIGNALEQLGNIFGRNLSRKVKGKMLPSDFTMRNDL